MEDIYVIYLSPQRSFKAFHSSQRTNGSRTTYRENCAKTRKKVYKSNGHFPISSSWAPKTLRSCARLTQRLHNCTGQHPVWPSTIGGKHCTFRGAMMVRYMGGHDYSLGWPPNSTTTWLSPRSSPQAGRLCVRFFTSIYGDPRSTVKLSWSQYSNARVRSLYCQVNLDQQSNILVCQVTTLANSLREIPSQLGLFILLGVKNAVCVGPAEPRRSVSARVVWPKLTAGEHESWKSQILRFVKRRPTIN